MRLSLSRVCVCARTCACTHPHSGFTLGNRSSIERTRLTVLYSFSFNIQEVMGKKESLFSSFLSWLKALPSGGCVIPVWFTVQRIQCGKNSMSRGRLLLVRVRLHLGGLKTHPVVVKDQLLSLWVLSRTCWGESARKPGAPWLPWTTRSTRSPGGAWTTRSFRPAWILRPLFVFCLWGGR